MSKKRVEVEAVLTKDDFIEELKNAWVDFKAVIEEAEPDATKFIERGNNAAGTRFRSILQDVRVRSKTMRDLVQKIKNVEE